MHQKLLSILTKYINFHTGVYSFVLNTVYALVLFFLFLLKLQATDGMDNLEQLINLNGGEGQIYTMEGPLCLKSVQSMFG